jgi:hypothetical protein
MLWSNIAGQKEGKWVALIKEIAPPITPALFLCVFMAKLYHSDVCRSRGLYEVSLRTRPRSVNRGWPEINAKRILGRKAARACFLSLLQE